MTTVQDVVEAFCAQVGKSPEEVEKTFTEQTADLVPVTIWVLFKDQTWMAIRSQTAGWSYTVGD